MALVLLLGSLLLTACTSSAPSAGITADNARLGTQWGESLDSRVTSVNMKRMGDRPLATNALRYAAAASGDEVVRELALASGRVGLRVIKDDGAAWPIYRKGGAEMLKGRDGQRYRLEYRNYSQTQTYEIVATVDGLDVLNGQAGNIRNRGYVLRPGAVLRIDGFRKSRDEVAAFRFGSVADSYAANSDAGSASNAGVIGTAIFALADLAPKNAPAATSCETSPCAFPNDGKKVQGGYAPAPNYRN